MMFKVSVFSILLASFVLAPFTYGASKTGPTSEIPDRREFPVSEGFKPCDDFYSYACQGAIDGFKLRDDRSAHTFAFSDSHERLLKAKQDFLQKITKSKDKLSPRSDTLRTVFQACMDVKGSKTNEHSIVKSTMAEVTKVKSPAEFNTMWFKANKTGAYMVWELDNISNQDDPLKNDVILLPSLMTLPERSYYDNPAVMKDFEAEVASFFKAIGRDKSDERAKSVVMFEKEFAQTFPLPAEFRDLFSKRTYIDKSKMIERNPGLGLAPLLATVPDSVPVRDLAPANFAWLEKAQKEKPIATLQDVYLWHALHGYVDDSAPAWRESWTAFNNKHLGGPIKRPVREERCTRWVMKTFDREIDAELVDVLFPAFPADRVVNLAEKIRASIIARLETNDWLKEATRKAAVEKLRTARLQLVKPRNDVEWDFNLPATYTKNHRVTNDMTLTVKQREKLEQRLKEPRNPNIWGMGPLTVNAYYSPSENKFVMPVGILQYPFFDKNAPDSVNLGAVGAVMGHELGHGIDDKGALYDKDGKLHQWMSDDEVKIFKERGKHLVGEFNAIGHNGQLTLGENMADLSGVSFAWDAAFPDSKGSVQEKKDFFLQYAHVWCEVMRPKLREMYLKTDPHSMGEARVNEQMKHQGGFAEVYQCKAGDKLWLEPKERVRIW